MLLSTELNKLVKKLDSRHKKSCKTGNFTSKPKVLSTASSLSPPPAAPKWAVKSSFVRMKTPPPPPIHVTDQDSDSFDSDSSSGSESETE